MTRILIVSANWIYYNVIMIYFSLNYNQRPSVQRMSPKFLFWNDTLRMYINGTNYIARGSFSSLPNDWKYMIIKYWISLWCHMRALPRTLWAFNCHFGTMALQLTAFVAEKRASFLATRARFDVFIWEVQLQYRLDYNAVCIS